MENVKREREKRKVGEEKKKKMGGQFGRKLSFYLLFIFLLQYTVSVEILFEDAS